MGNTRQYKTLVTAGEVINNTFTNKNTDPVLVSNNTIVLSELAHIRPLLGDKFYAELKLQNNTDALSVNNQILMDFYLQVAESWFVRFEVINDIMSNITSSGVVHNVDEFNSVITPSDYNTFKQDTYRKAEIYLQDMLSFLNDSDNSADYPTYTANAPCNVSTYKNHGIIMYDSIYTRPRTNYNSWKDFCPEC